MFVCVLTIVCLFSATVFAVGAEPVDFQRDVAPIFQQRCLSCHNDRDQRGGLSLQSAEMARNGGESGTVIEPGDEASSYLLESLVPSDGNAEMPSARRSTRTRLTSSVDGLRKARCGLMNLSSIHRCYGRCNRSSDLLFRGT